MCTTNLPRVKGLGLASGSARQNGDREHSALLSLPPPATVRQWVKPKMGLPR